MERIQLVSLTPEECNQPIFDYIDKKFNEFNKHFQSKEPSKFLTRKEVAELLSVNLSSVHNMTVKGVLQKHQISGRVLYLRAEVEDSIIKLKN